MKRLTFISVLFAVVLLVSRSYSASTYEIVDLGALSSNPTAGHAINENGQVTGWGQRSDSYWHAFVASEQSSINDIGTLPSADSSQGWAINDSGQVAGRAWNTTSTYHRAFLYDGSQMTDLGTLEGTSQASSWAMGMNNAGTVVGSSDDSSGRTRAFLYNGTMTDLGSSGLETLGGTWSCAYDINNNGQVTGWVSLTGGVTRAFFWQNGTAQTLGVLTGDGYSCGLGMNDDGTVVGFSKVDGGSDLDKNAFIWDSVNGMRFLGNLGSQGSEAYSINSQNQIVGILQDSVQRAFLWENDVMYDLNDLISPSSDWNLLQARSINDNGFITGLGIIDGEYHAYILKPVAIPEPLTIILFVIGLGIKLIVYKGKSVS